MVLYWNCRRLLAWWSTTPALLQVELYQKYKTRVQISYFSYGFVCYMIGTEKRLGLHQYYVAGFKNPSRTI